jgi:hypothetical protein
MASLDQVPFPLGEMKAKNPSDNLNDNQLTDAAVANLTTTNSTIKTTEQQDSRDETSSTPATANSTTTEQNLRDETSNTNSTVIEDMESTSTTTAIPDDDDAAPQSLSQNDILEYLKIIFNWFFKFFMQKN